MPILKNWSVGIAPADMWQAPEIRPKSLGGEVYGHHKIQDGHKVVTSALVELDIAQGIARTRSGSVYLLTDPDPVWVKWCETNAPQYFDQLNNKVKEKT